MFKCFTNKTIKEQICSFWGTQNDAEKGLLRKTISVLWT